jgi:prephenate dehydratase
MKAAFQGERGAFSEEAGRRLLGEDIEMLPCREFDALFATVTQGTADAAVVPVENTLAGSVMKNYDLLTEHDLVIVGEVVLRVVHNLIAKPGATLEGLRRVYSHPVALAQCEAFLRRHPHLEVLTAYDTAGSVKMIMQTGRPDEAAIASAAAAAAWGAEVLVPAIESNAQNFTRFVILTRPERAPDFAGLAQGRERKTSVVFRIANQPGGLHRALAAFADEGIDLTKIESRPIPGRPFEYTFYLDFLGDGSAPPVNRALMRLRGLAENIRVLGSYPRAES